MVFLSLAAILVALAVIFAAINKQSVTDYVRQKLASEKAMSH